MSKRSGGVKAKDRDPSKVCKVDGCRMYRRKGFEFCINHSRTREQHSAQSKLGPAARRGKKLRQERVDIAIAEVKRAQAEEQARMERVRLAAEVAWERPQRVRPGEESAVEDSAPVSVIRRGSVLYAERPRLAGEVPLHVT